MFDEYDDLLTVREACDILKIGRNSLYKLLSSGKIKAYRNGNRWYILKENVIDYMRKASCS